MPTLLSPITVGRMSLKNRIVLAPLTRIRNSHETMAPLDLGVEYYSQRASDGALLISEATYISPESIGSETAPGIWSPEQVAGWKRVTDAVHAKGGFIYCQLWHIGRVAHVSFNEHHLVKGSKYTVCRSASDVAIAAEGTALGGAMKPHVAPVPFELEEIDRLRNDYVTAAKNAIEAGFDGVELHGAHGYLIDQFLNSGTNKRTDRYGGSAENRSRLLDEVLGDLCAAVGKDRVALRLSPHNNDPLSAFFGVTDANPEETYAAAFAVAAKHALAYVLVTEPRWSRMGSFDENQALTQMPAVNGEKYGPAFRAADPNGVLIGASGFTPTSAETAVQKGVYDMTGFGRWFISNPDLPSRIINGYPLNKYDRSTFYSSGSEGYTDYPMFEQVCEALGENPAAYAPLAEDASAEDVAAREAKIEELVQKAEGKLKYGLMSVKTLGVSTSLSN